MENNKYTAIEIDPEFTEEERRKIFEFCVMSAFASPDSQSTDFGKRFEGEGLNGYNLIL